MSRISWKLSLTLVAGLFILAGTERASAQGVVVVPGNVSYYAPPPVVSYYAPPPVVYTPPVQRVSYYTAPPTVSYYAPPVTYAPPVVSYYTPAVSYYAPPVAAVTTTRYGLFGRPRETSVYYYPR